MPTYNSAQSLEGFVSLAQLCSSPDSFQGDDMADGQYFDFDMPLHLRPLFPNGFEQAPTPWEVSSCQPLRRSATMPMIPEYSNSSPSSSPSPTETVQQQQHQKRRAQNRAAQRAYRDRKVRHLVDLEQGIRDIEKKMLHLQNENTELIRQLCETRASNNQMKTSNTPQRFGKITSRGKNGSSAARSLSDGDRPFITVDNIGSEEAESLYEPFAAMWNLIRLDPSVAGGKVSARMVLENLSRLAENGSSKLEHSPIASPMVADDEDSQDEGSETN